MEHTPGMSATATLHRMDDNSLMAEIILLGDPMKPNELIGPGRLHRFRILEGRLHRAWSRQWELLLKSPGKRFPVKIAMLPTGEDGQGVLIYLAEG